MSAPGGQALGDPPPQDPHANSQATAEAHEKEVLVLYGLTSSLPVISEWGTGIRKGLQDSQGRTPKRHVEFLDLARFDDEQYRRQWVSLIRYKYSDRDIPVVICVFDLALEFAATHLRDVFPDAVFLFASVEEQSAQRLIGDRDVTGIVYRVDVAKTSELALQLRPGTRRVVCISGSSDFDKAMTSLARRELASAADKLHVEYWQGVPLDEMEKRVRQLPDDCVVIFLVYFADETGLDHVPAEVVAALSDASSVPVFCLYDTLLSFGAVGGHVVRMNVQALEAGRMARQILDGESVDRLPARGQELNRSIVDWRRLQHWSIPEASIPAGALILNRTPSFWESYRWQISATLGLVLLQSTLMVAVLLNRWRRKRAERELAASQEDAHQQREQLARVARVSTMGELATSIAHEVKQPLFAIVSNAQTGVRLLAQDQPDRQEVVETLQDIASDGNRAALIVDRVRSLTRKYQPTMRQLDLNSVVRDVLPLLKLDDDGQRVVVRVILAESLPPVTGDRIALQQVILNLLINGAQAMRDTDPTARKLIVRTDLDADSVHLRVRDCGVGLDDEQLAHMFDPFFTTKPGGMGMGLAINRTIVGAHNGKMWATRNPDEGATLHVTLPAAPAGP